MTVKEMVGDIVILYFNDVCVLELEVQTSRYR